MVLDPLLQYVKYEHDKPELVAPWEVAELGARLRPSLELANHALLRARRSLMRQSLELA